MTYLYIPRAGKCVSSSVELLCGLAMLAYVPAAGNTISLYATLMLSYSA